MLTNSFRIWDEVGQRFLQAEVGIEVNDMHVSQENHRTLRELGASMQAMQQRTLELDRKELLGRIAACFYSKRRQLDEKKRQAEEWVTAIAKELNRVKAESIGKTKLAEVSQEIISLESENRRLANAVTEAKSLDSLAGCRVEVETFECLDE